MQVGFPKPLQFKDSLSKEKGIISGLLKFAFQSRFHKALAMVLMLLIAGSAVAFAADQLIADADTLTTTEEQTRNLGIVQPGATVKPVVDFYVDCNGNNHFNSNETASVSPTSFSASPAGTSLPSATTASNFPGPTSWPADGNSSCSVDNAKVASSTVTIVAPTAPGTYTYTVNYGLSRGTGLESNELAGIQNSPVTFTLTVPQPTSVATTTTVASNANPSTYGNPVTFTSTVNASSGSNPNGVGTVTFKDGANDLCTSVALSGNTATCTTTARGLTAGSHSISAQYSGGSGYQGSTTASSLTQTVNKKIVPGSFTASNKVYDGNTNATISGSSLGTGVVSGDTVTLSGGSATFDTKDVGSGKTVTGTGFTLGGADANNYSLLMSTTTANITKAPLTASFTANDKVYDGTTAATIASRDVVGEIGTDTVSLGTSGTATFATKNVENGKTVTGTGFALSGTDAGNYSLVTTPSPTTTADITPLGVTASFTAANKVYDGTTSATIASRDVVGEISGDTVSLIGGTATFATKNVGNGKTVTGAGFSLSGTDAGNYTLATTPSPTTTADITPLGVTASFTASNKVYDGTTAATIASRDVVGEISGDTVNLGTSGTATFATKNVGNGKTVTGTGFSLSGTDAGNYTLATTPSPTTTADITPLGVTASFTASDKVYDGSTSATIIGSSLGTGVVSGDIVSLDASSATAQFNNKNVGQNKTVTGTGFALSGADAGNYTLSSVGSTTADITARPITVTAASKSKTYGDDDPTTLTYSVTSGSLVTGDSFTGSLTRNSGENVGSYAIKQGTLSAGSNYNLTFVDGTLTVNKATLTVKADNANRYYGDANPTFTASYTGFKFSDTENVLSGTPTLTTGANAGSDVGAYDIVASDGTLAAANYSFVFQNGTLTVNKAPLTIKADNANRYYGDANPTFTGSIVSGSIKNNDAVSLAFSTTATATSAPGTYDIVPSLSGTKASNYDVTAQNGTLTVKAWTFNGFFQPVDMNNVLNTVKAGSTVPIKFELFKGTTELTDIANVVTPLSAKGVSCGTTVTDDIELTATGSTSLRYDTTGGQFIYNWQTPKGPVGSCYAVTISAKDGSAKTAYFKLK